jgi:hypothetical protein
VNPTLADPRRVQARRLGQGLLAGALVAAMLVGAAVTMEATRLPSFVPRLTMVNPTPYQVEVDVTGEDRDGWLSLGGLRRESTKSMYEVIDQGDSWIFRFGYGGQAGGETRLTGAQLRADRWHVRIPPEVGDRLRAAGMPPSA